MIAFMILMHVVHSKKSSQFEIKRFLRLRELYLFLRLIAAYKSREWLLIYKNTVRRLLKCT